MSKEQEQSLLKILFTCTDILHERLDKLTLQVTDTNNKLKENCNETGYLKLSLDASLNIYEDKLNNVEKTIKFEKIRKNYKIRN